jgi:hypothetical protein
MKKYLLIILLILVACEPDRIDEITNIDTTELIFDSTEVSITNGQDISFEILSTTQHQLIISTQDGSVLSKESFIPTFGLNTRKIYTKTLPKEVLQLILVNGTETIKKTHIIIQ